MHPNPGSRRVAMGDQRPPPRTKLDRFNDLQVGGHYHPTKGWRKMNPKRPMAAYLTAEAKAGRPLPMEGLRVMIERMAG